MKRLLLVACIFFCSTRYALARDCAVANGDAEAVDDVATTTASGVITSAAAPWVVGDVGKTIFCISGGTTNIAVTTIAAYTNAGQITTLATSAGSAAGVKCVWATGDSTSAITTQVTACKGGAGSTFPASRKFFGGDPGRVTISGGYIVSGCVYDVTAVGGLPSLVGSGRDNTILFQTPTFSACASGPLLIYGAGQGMTLSGFSVDGNGILRSVSVDLIRVINSGQFNILDINVLNEGSSNAAHTALNIQDCAYGRLSQVFVQNAPSGDKSTACKFQMAGTVTETFCSNHWRNLLVNNGSGRTPTTLGMTWIGGGADECGDPLSYCTIISANSEFQVDGATFFSAVQLAAGSRFYGRNLNIGRYTSPDRGPGLVIESTAIARVGGSTIRATAGAKAVVNRGKFVDLGGNDYKDCTNSSCTAKTASQSFSGPQPVRE